MVKAPGTFKAVVLGIARTRFLRIVVLALLLYSGDRTWHWAKMKIAHAQNMKAVPAREPFHIEVRGATFDGRLDFNQDQGTGYFDGVVGTPEEARRLILNGPMDPETALTLFDVLESRGWEQVESESSLRYRLNLMTDVPVRELSEIRVSIRRGPVTNEFALHDTTHPIVDAILWVMTHLPAQKAPPPAALPEEPEPQDPP